MATITEDYVSFETAKLLKEKRFDEYTAMLYNQNGSFMPNGAIEDTYQTFYSAPTLQMAMKWLREVYKIFILVQPDYPESCNYKLCWAWSVNILKEDCIQLKSYGCNCDSYKAACEAACLYCLRNLI